MSEASRQGALEAAGLVHPHPDAVSAPLFARRVLPGRGQGAGEVRDAAGAPGRAVRSAPRRPRLLAGCFYLVAALRAGRDGRAAGRAAGRRGPVKLRPEIEEFIRWRRRLSGAELAEQVAARFGVMLHRRTIERARGR